MSTIKNDGGKAFPILDRINYKADYLSHGMTLRDYFAAKAMAAYLCQNNGQNRGTMDVCAKASYMMADALLSERAKFYAKEEQK